MSLSTHVMAARWIVPVSRKPINGGWIRFCGEEIVEIGQGKPPAEADDLGDAAILPGLINAHTHLEFSDCRRPIGEPGIALHDWIGEVITARGATSLESKQLAITQGLQESEQSCVRLIGEIATPPFRYPDTEAQLVTFAEVLGLSNERSGERLAVAMEHNETFDHAAWSPHAPYSTSLPTIEACVKNAVRTSRPLAMHVAESTAERELLTSGSGPFATTLQSIGVWREGLFPWGDDPFLNLIDLLSSAPRGLVVHGNDLRQHEIDQLAQHTNLAVVYCPRTHDFFGHSRHPVQDLLNAGVKVALGTDSRASNPDLDLWGEVQFLLNNRQDLDPCEVLKMATLHGASTFGQSNLGRLEIGCKPGIKLVRTAATNEQELFASFATV
ncbi:MAG: amidohydrolase family protein [Rubripirellula sp.]